MSHPVPIEADIQTVLLDAICEALSGAIIVYDKHDHILYASRQIRNYFPVPQSFLTPGTRLRDFLGAMYDNGGRQVGAASASREEWISERIAAHWRERSELQLRDSRNRWAKLVKRRLSSGFGICMVTDITDSKKRDEQWRADVERVQLTEEILDNLPHPIFVEDRNLSLVAVNKALCDLLDVSADALLGRRAADAFAGAFAADLEASGRHVLETGAPSTTTRRLLHEDGSETAAVIRAQRVGKPGRYFVVTGFEDVTEYVAAASVSAGTKEASPGPRIVPYALPAETQIDSAAELPPFPRPMTGRKVLVVTADRHFELLGLSVLTNMGIDACAVRSAAEEDAFLGVAGSAGVAIDLVVVDVQMDVRCLELATEHGVPVLPLEGYQLATDLAFHVPRHLSERFARDDLSLDDWEITTEGDEGHGHAAVDVLVVEDNEINQIVFAQILESLGYSYEIAATGPDAVRLYAELSPRIVLMDITLPGMNGIAACRAIRELEATGPQTPIIGVLVQAFDRDRSECAEAGMNDVILKPVSPDMIEAVFERYLPIRAEESAL